MNYITISKDDVMRDVKRPEVSTKFKWCSRNRQLMTVLFAVLAFFWWFYFHFLNVSFLCYVYYVYNVYKNR